MAYQIPEKPKLPPGLRPIPGKGPFPIPRPPKKKRRRRRQPNVPMPDPAPKAPWVPPWQKQGVSMEEFLFFHPNWMKRHPKRAKGIRRRRAWQAKQLAEARKRTLAPMTPEQLAAEADRRVDASLNPQIEAIKAMTPIVARILGDRMPAIQGAFGNAGAALAGAGAGFAGDSAGRAAAAQAEAEGFAASQGLPGGTEGFNPDAIQNATYAPSFNVSGSLATQGALAANRQAAEVAISAIRSKEDLMAIAAKRPELRSQILSELYDREIQKAQLRIQQDAQNLYEDQFGLEEKKFKEEKRQFNISARLEAMGLALREKAAEAAVRRALAQGREVDASASRLLGYLVDQHGRPILRNGKKIRVKSEATDKDRREQYQDAVAESRDILGDPILNADVSPLRPGRYIAAPGAKGVFPPKGPGGVATTNDPKKARRDSEYTWAQAMKFLRSRFGISRTQARRALIAAGWIPPPSGPRAINHPH